MAKYASKVVEQAKAWLGRNEADGTHRAIIDIYNAHKPLARGYKMTYNDAWCAATVSAIAIKLGYTDIIPTECSCTRMIELFKKLGAWTEADCYRPKAGDIIFYDWDDSGRGDNTGSPDHVGIVEKVSGGVITVIEGNYKNAVTRREIAINGKFIRGYGVPKYDTEVAAKPADNKKPAAVNAKVLAFQKAMIADGIALPRYGADGIWGEETENAATYYLQKGSTGERVKTMQSLLKKAGYDLGKAGVDGIFGSKTDEALRAFQKAQHIVVDGVFGPETAKPLLGV